MLLLLAAAALASDAHPGLLHPSAVAMDDDRVQIEASGAVLAYVWSAAIVSGDGHTGGVTLQASADLTRRLRVHAYAGTGWDASSWGSAFGAGGGSKDTMWDATAGIGFALIDKKDFRLTPYVTTGTRSQVGLAVWWRSTNGRFEFDASGGPAVRTERFFDPYGPVIELVGATLPDAGVTFNLDTKDRHHLRLGVVSAMPSLTYRVTLGSFALEAAAGSVGVVTAGRLGVGAQF